MNYKRLTTKLNTGTYYLSCENCTVEDNTNCESYDCKGLAFQRLGELEDKIEQGRLIELPCKVGDTVYHFSHRPFNLSLKANTVYAANVLRIVITGSAISLITQIHELYVTEIGRAHV